MSSSPSPAPTIARVASTSQWANLFHPTEGVFRHPSTNGESIGHLDIDLRFVQYEPDSTDAPTDIRHVGPIYLPRVCRLSLRGAEYVQNSEERMGCLDEVFRAINPIEVQWLTACNDPSEQLTLSTHLVHSVVVSAGERWRRDGGLRKLVVQGGFPCPNPSATTARSPHSPALLERSSEQRGSNEFILDPSFEYAFGAWGPEELRWRLEGRYSSACILSILTNLLRALASSYPSASTGVHVALPSLLIFSRLPNKIEDEVRALPAKLELSGNMRTYLEDVVFTSVDSIRHSRLWTVDTQERDRHARRLKGEMLLLASGDAEIIPPGGPYAFVQPVDPHSSGDRDILSPAGSIPSLESEDEAQTDDEVVATTPDLFEETGAVGNGGMRKKAYLERISVTC